MNIFVIVYHNPWSINSAGNNRFLTLIEPLVDKGVCVSLLIYGGFKDSLERDKWKKKGVYNYINYEYVYDLGINSIRVQSFFSNYILPFFSKSIINRISKKISDNSIVWVEPWKLGYEILFNLKLTLSRNIYFTEINEFIDIYKLNKVNYLEYCLEKRNHNFFLKRALMSYDGIALMTKVLIDQFIKYENLNARILHLPMTVDLERFKSPKEVLPEFISPYIAFVGVMNDSKDGVSSLIDAFSRLNGKYGKYKLYLVGSWNHDTPNHLKLIEKLGLINQVFWMGEYQRDDIPKIVCNADLLVLPRPDSKQAQGGFPTKLGEYLASGKPVCATRVGEIPDYLEDNESVFFAEPGCVESFAEAMDRALSNPLNAQRVGLNGRKVAEKEFNSKIQAEKLYEFFKTL